VGGAYGTPTSWTYVDTNLYRPAEPCFKIDYGVELTPDDIEGSGYRGATVDYALTLSNTGTVPDTYTVTVSSIWTVTHPITVGPVAPYSSTGLLVSVDIPYEADIGDFDVAEVVATSQGDPGVDATTLITTTAVTDWTEAEPISQNTAAFGAAQCADDPDSFYVIGGSAGEFLALDEAWRYDSVTNQWNLLATLPIPLANSSATCHEGEIFVVGGWEPTSGVTNTLFIYDIEDNIWVEGSPVPRNVYLGGVGTWNGMLYRAGGTSGGWVPITAVDIYDIATDTWQVAGGRSLPFVSMAGGYIQAGPYLYVIGGFTNGPNSQYTQRYNMAEDEWEQGPQFTSHRAMLSLALTESHLYAFGGTPTIYFADVTNLVEVLDLSDWPGGIWQATEDPLPEAVEMSSGYCTEAIAGGEIWSVGGGLYTDEWIIYDTNYYHAAEPCLGYNFSPALAPEEQSEEGLPGGTVAYTQTLTNGGDTPDAYDITMTSTWPTTITYPEGVIDPGASIVLSVSVEIPAEALPGEIDTATITATSQGDPMAYDTATITTTAVGEYEVILSPESDGMEDYPGTSVTYDLVVTNIGDFYDTYSVTVSATWTTSAVEMVGPLAQDESAVMTVTVDIPDDALPYDFDVAEVTVTSMGDAGVSDSAVLTTEVKSPYDVEVDPDTATLSGMTGETIEYTLMVTNTGIVSDTFEITYTGNTWDVHLPVTMTSLSAGEMVYVTVHVIVPEDATLGDMDTVTITATSQGDPSQLDSSELTTVAMWYEFYLPRISSD
jgi:uncharacterized membrane protein